MEYKFIHSLYLEEFFHRPLITEEIIHKVKSLLVFNDFYVEEKMVDLYLDEEATAKKLDACFGKGVDVTTLNKADSLVYMLVADLIMIFDHFTEHNYYIVPKAYFDESTFMSCDISALMKKSSVISPFFIDAIQDRPERLVQGAHEGFGHLTGFPPEDVSWATVNGDGTYPQRQGIFTNGKLTLSGKVTTNKQLDVIEFKQEWYPEGDEAYFEIVEYVTENVDVISMGPNQSVSYVKDGKVTSPSDPDKFALVLLMQAVTGIEVSTDYLCAAIENKLKVGD